MISVIITSYKEEKTIGKAIESILKNNLQDYEIIVTAPDNETLNAARRYKKHNKNIRVIKDKREGKPSALNLAISKVRGDTLILTDGDVYVGANSLNFLLEPFKDKDIGAVSGNPTSINSKDNMLGFWSHLLTKVASERRSKALKSRKRFFCSGYLFAIRKNLFPKLPKNLLSEDGYVSNYIYTKGYSISYSEKSKVYVKYPSNFSDWIKQKKRSAGGYNQIRKMSGVEMRSFKKEALGAFEFFKFVGNLKEFFWLISLFFSRIYLWFIIYKDVNIHKKSHKEIWQRVESTK